MVTEDNRREMTHAWPGLLWRTAGALQAQWHIDIGIATGSGHCWQLLAY